MNIFGKIETKIPKNVIPLQRETKMALLTLNRRIHGNAEEDIQKSPYRLVKGY